MSQLNITQLLGYNPQKGTFTNPCNALCFKSKSLESPVLDHRLAYVLIERKLIFGFTPWLKGTCKAPQLGQLPQDPTSITCQRDRDQRSARIRQNCLCHFQVLCNLKATQPRCSKSCAKFLCSLKKSLNS